MISHDNIMYLCRFMALDVTKLMHYKERLISYLPLSHIAAQLLDVHLSVFLGSTVYFAQPDALKGSLVTTMNEIKPTFFFGVPRVWEKMQQKIEATIKEQQGVKAMIFDWARRQATWRINATFNGSTGNSIFYTLAQTIVLNRVKQALGLSECRNMFSGAAPIKKDTLDFFISLGLPLCEVFGKIFIFHVIINKQKFINLFLRLTKACPKQQVRAFVSKAALATRFPLKPCKHGLNTLFSFTFRTTYMWYQHG
jgi:long-chain-fatty-acid--CoA ligase ACSBG